MKNFIGLENFQTQLGERLKISGGQKQKLQLQEHYIEKRYHLLDEFTSSLDKQNEIFFEVLNKIKQNKIIILSSHSAYLAVNVIMCIKLDKKLTLSK